MDAQQFDVVRALDTTPEFRDQSVDGSIGTLNGHFSVFNTWYEVASAWEGNFLERTAPGAFAETIVEDRADMRVLFDHGYDPQIGNKVLGPIASLEEDKRGPAYEVPLYDTTYNRDLLPGLKGGQYGASFRFRVLEETWNDEPKPSRDNPKGLPERTITKAKVMEFGPVTFGANPDATAGVRSLTDQFYDRLQQRDSTAYAEAARAAGRTKPVTVVGEQGPERITVSSGSTVVNLSDMLTAGTASAVGGFVSAGAAASSLTGQSGTRSAGGGEATQDDDAGASDSDTPNPESAARYRALQLIGVIR